MRLVDRTSHERIALLVELASASNVKMELRGEPNPVGLSFFSVYGYGANGRDWNNKHLILRKVFNELVVNLIQYPVACTCSIDEMNSYFLALQAC